MIYQHPSKPLPIPTEWIPKFGGRVFARYALYVIDWLRATPEFWEIDPEDRVGSDFCDFRTLLGFKRIRALPLIQIFMIITARN